MNNRDDNEGAGSGAITGLVLAAAASWSRQDDDTQNRIRALRHDARDALAQIRELNSRGEVIRGRLPTVMDALTGLALANPVSPSANVLPSNVPHTRPQLVSIDPTGPSTSAVEDMTWPPKAGSYDEEGLVRESGDLTTLFLAMTYEETRAAFLGLVQARQPNKVQKVEIFYAFNSLISVLYGLKLTYAEFVEAWKRLFTGTGTGTVLEADPHREPGKPPTITSASPLLQSALPLGMPELPLQTFHQNTDLAHKWRLSVGAGAIGAGSTVITVAFGTMFLKNGKPYQPTVICATPGFAVTSITPTGFVVTNTIGLTAGTQYDIWFAVVPG